MRNLYEAPGSNVQPRPDRDGLRAFTGTDKYLDKWSGLIEGSSRFAGFNWAAFFFGTLWFVYRKLYIWAIVVFLVSLATADLLAFVLLLVAPETSLPAVGIATVLGEFLLIRLPAGLFANVIYFRKAAIAVQDAHAHSEGEREAYLRKKGGTNEMLMWGAFFVLMLLRIAGALIQYSNGGS